MTINNRKVAIVGCGMVGSSSAFSLLTQGICDVILMVDLNEEKTCGEVFDLNNCIEYLDCNTKVMYGTYADCANADIIIIAANAALSDDEEETNTMQACANTIKFIVEPIISSGFDGIFINVCDPMDTITQYIYELSGLPKNQVLGIGTALDTARLKNILARLVGVSIRNIQAYTMGEHDSKQIVPWSCVTIDGKSIYDLIADNPELTEGMELDELVQKTIKQSWESIEQKSAANYGAATTIAGIVKAIFNDENKMISVSTLLEGEYEENGVFCSVPSIINRKGVYNVTEIHMSKAELIKFKESAKNIRENLIKTNKKQ